MSMTMNGAVLPVLAMYIVAAEEQVWYTGDCMVMVVSVVIWKWSSILCALWEGLSYMVVLIGLIPY